MSKWPLTKIGKFLTPRQITPDPKKISSGEFSIVSKISFASGQIEIRDHAKTNTNMITIMPGDLVVSGINAGKGAIAIYGKDNKNPATATIHYSSYEVNSDLADIEYLWYFFRSENFREILRLSLPNGIKTELRPNKFIALEIPLPPLPEQKRIVKKIKEIEEKVKEITKLENYIGNAVDNIVPSALEKIFGASSWEKDQIGNLIEEIKTGTTPPSGERKYYNEEINWFTPSDFKGQMYLENSYRKISQLAIDDGKVKTYRAGTILFIGIGATLGKVGVLKNEASSNQQITGIRFKKNILPEFAYYWFKANYSEIRGLCPATTLPILNQEKIKKLIFSYPKSIAEQKQIIDHLNLIENKKEEIKQEKKKKYSIFSALMPSVLSKAFNGEL